MSKSEMRKVLKLVLALMAVLTLTYVGFVAYANANFSHRYVTYAALKYEQDTTPTEWYTPEELGIVEIREADAYSLQINVNREKEPFPFGPYGTDDQPTIFLYKDEFYVVSSRWVTFADGNAKQWQIPILGALAVGVVFSRVLFLRRSVKESKR